MLYCGGEFVKKVKKRKKKHSFRMNRLSRLSISSLISRGRHTHILCALWLHKTTQTDTKSLSSENPLDGIMCHLNYILNWLIMCESCKIPLLMSINRSKRFFPDLRFTIQQRKCWWPLKTELKTAESVKTFHFTYYIRKC